MKEVIDVFRSVSVWLDDSVVLVLELVVVVSEELRVDGGTEEVVLDVVLLPSGGSGQSHSDGIGFTGVSSYCK